MTKIPMQSLRDFCSKEEIQYMAIFGSFADGTSHENSDIDILVSFVHEDKIGLLRFIQVKQNLEDMLGLKVDLVSRKALNSKIKEQIKDSLIEVYNAA